MSMRRGDLTLLLLLLVGRTAAPGAAQSPSPPVAVPIRAVNVAASDLAYDPATQRIYASVGDPALRSYTGSKNSLVAIEPVTGQIGPSFLLDGKPGKLAIATPGRYLYALLDGGARVVRFDTVNGAPGLEFSTDTGSGASAVADMAVVPGSPGSVALSLTPGVSGAGEATQPGISGVFVVDGGVPRLQFAPGASSLAFLDSTRLYGYDSGTGFRRMTLDAAGVTVDDATRDLITGPGVQIQYDQGLLLTTSGQVIDPEAREVLGAFSGLGTGAAMAADVERGRVYYLIPTQPVSRLAAFDPHTFAAVRSWEIPGVAGVAGRLVRWGQERSDGGGLAVATGSQVLLFSLAGLDQHPVEFSLGAAPGQFRRLVGGPPFTAQVELTAPAPVGGATIQLSTSDPSVATAPPSLVIPAGVLIAPFPVSTRPVATATDITITGSLARVSRSYVLHLVPPVLISGGLTASTVYGDATVIGTVTLDGPAPSGGLVILLSSSDPTRAFVQPRVTIAPGQISASFPIQVHGTDSIYGVDVSATVASNPSATGITFPIAALPARLAAPTNLTARVLSGAARPPGGGVQLSWQDNSGDENAFAVWRRTGSSDWVRIAVLAPNTTGFLDANVAPGTTYTYRVRATRGNVASDWSNEVTVTLGE